MKFIDAKALIGRPIKAPDSELNVEIQPQSRSLQEIIKWKRDKNIHAQIKNGLRLDLSNVIGDKIVIKKRHAIKFANWILNTYSKPKDKTNGNKA